MSFRNSLGNLLVAALMLLMTATPFSLLAAETQSADHQRGQPGAVFSPSKDAVADLKATLKKAESEQKLALVILGADWCHDSLALAARLQDEPLKSLVDEKYETLLVNVGNFSEGREVIQSLGVPIYYATPTVLIVEPASGQLVNNGNRNMWGNAASVSMNDSISYFQTMADFDLSTLPDENDFSAEHIQLLAEIDEFEQAQAERLAEAYIITGAMLEKHFDQAVWQEVGKYRNTIARDVDALRAEVAQRIAAGETDIVLAYPGYSPWSWTPQANADEKL